MGIKQKLEKALHEVPKSKSEEHKILSQLNDVVLARQDYDLPSSIILRSHMNKTSVTNFLSKNLGIPVQDVVFLPFAISSGESTYQVKLS